MPAGSRSTAIASELESFLDSNEDDLSPNMFKKLDDLAEEIDRQAEALERRIGDLEEEVRELQREAE
jgi:archaellum component FlaC